MLLIVAFAFIFFVARGCVANQEATQIRKYVTSSDSALSESSSIGSGRLQGILQEAGGDPAKLDEEALSKVVEDSNRRYQRSLANEEVPPEFESADHYLATALGIRASATERLEKAATGDPASFKQTLSAAVEDYQLSDAVVRDHYLEASRSALEETGQQDSESYLYEPEPFMDYDELGVDAGAASSSPATRNAPNALHGVEITSVKVAGKTLAPGANVTLTGSDELNFAVAVTNGGEARETGVPVEIVLNTKVERQSQTATIDQIDPKESATVEVAGFRPGELNESAEVSIKVGPVKYEDYLENNTTEGTVTFGM